MSHLFTHTFVHVVFGVHITVFYTKHFAALLIVFLAATNAVSINERAVRLGRKVLECRKGEKRAAALQVKLFCLFCVASFCLLFNFTLFRCLVGLFIFKRVS